MSKKVIVAITASVGWIAGAIIGYSFGGAAFLTIILVAFALCGLFFMAALLLAVIVSMREDDDFDDSPFRSQPKPE